jgi:nitroimidazol reductase NimA-like FMN-containing flavoprotein (pyridoxamine 5'-phosphate oxidase superfamily)
MGEHPVEPREAVLEELDRAECFRLLAGATFGRVAVAVPNWSFPVIRPVNFVFDESMNAVVFRSARGSKLTALLLSHAAVFEVDGADELIKQGWSVIVAGRVEEIERPLDLSRVERLGVEPWASGDKPHWLLIRTEMVTGRRIRRP